MWLFFAYGRFARQHFPQRNAIRKSQKHDELSKNKLENFTSEIYELRIRNQINEAHVFLGAAAVACAFLFRCLCV